MLDNYSTYNTDELADLYNNVINANETLRAQLIEIISPLNDSELHDLFYIKSLGINGNRVIDLIRNLEGSIIFVTDYNEYNINDIKFEDLYILVDELKSLKKQDYYDNFNDFH